jgi:hypothetical protein
VGNGRKLTEELWELNEGFYGVNVFEEFSDIFYVKFYEIDR